MQYHVYIPTKVHLLSLNDLFKCITSNFYFTIVSGGDEMEGEPLDLPGGIVLGGIMHKRTPIFFSATFGFVSITPVNTSSIDVLNTYVFIILTLL